MVSPRQTTRPGNRQNRPNSRQENPGRRQNPATRRPPQRPPTAADQILDRLNDNKRTAVTAIHSPLLDNTAYNINASTSHAFCAKILGRYGDYIELNRNFAIYDKEKQMAVIKTILDLLNLNSHYRPHSVVSDIRAMKSKPPNADGSAQRSARCID